MNNFLKIASLYFLVLFSTVESYSSIQNEAKTPILTPSLANRTTEKIELDNGLQAVITSDPKIEQSTAVLTVLKGSWDEPNEHPGLAHFLEHMLFLGTKKYPNESEYHQFIAQHGGITNAFTSSDYTSYIFSVDNDVFPEALDRFSDFFKEPLFNASGIDREAHAVHEEYTKNLESDTQRWFFLLKSLSNPNHPISRFNIGSEETLAGVTPEILRQWHANHYSANIMKVAVHSPLPIEELKGLIADKFSGIPNENQERIVTSLPVHSKELEGKMVYIQPIQNIRDLFITWELPQEVAKQLESQPEHVICYILGHEGKESLLAQLKREKLANSLACGVLSHGKSNSHLYLNLSLTDLGVEERWTVIRRCFQAIAAIKNEGISKELFDEIQQLAKIDYQYQPREEAFNLAMKEAHGLQREEMKTYPEKQRIIQKYDPNLIHEVVTSLTPENGEYYLLAPASLTGVKAEQKEKWFYTPYSIRQIPEQAFNEWKETTSSHFKINLPPPNPFVPQNLQLVHPQVESDLLPLVPTPSQIINNDFGQLYFAPDHRYHVPKVFMDFEILTPQVDMGKAIKTVLADLFTKSVEEALNKTSYNAALAGLNYKIEQGQYGIRIQIEGYNDKAQKLLEEILKHLKSSHPTEEKFAVYKQALLRKYQNFSKEPALTQAIEEFKSAIYKQYTTERKKAIALRRITYERFIQYATTLFDDIFINGLVYGNFSKQEAMDSWKNIQTTLKGAPYPKSLHKKAQVLLLPENKGPFYLEQLSKAQSSAIILGLEYDDFSFQNRAAQQILMQAMGEAFFNELRTKQQTAYIVHAFGEELEKQLFNLFAIQSASYGVKDLLNRFETFIENYNRDLIDEPTFHKIQKGLINKLTTPQKNLKKMGQLLTLLAFKHEGQFDWPNKRIEALQELNYDDFLKISHLNLSKENRRRLAILLKGASEDDLILYKPLKDTEELKKLSSFKNYY